MLNNVTVVNDALITSELDGTAVSEPKTQLLDKNYFRKISNLRTEEYNKNIIIFNTLSEIHLPSEPNGSKLRIKDVNDNIEEVILSESDYEESTLKLFSGDTTVDNLNNFTDNRGNSIIKLNTAVSSSRGWYSNFLLDVGFLVNPKTFDVKFISYNDGIDCELRGSKDGITWDKLLDIPKELGDETSHNDISISTSEYYRYFNFTRSTGSDYLAIYLYGFNIGITTYKVTNVITTPYSDIVSLIKLNEIKINGLNSGYITDYHDIKTGLMRNVYNSFTIPPAREVVTTANMGAGNIISEIFYEVDEIKYTAGNSIHTSNTQDGNTVSSVGLTTPDDAYKVFDGIDEPAFSEAVPSDGVIDIQHIYNLATPVTCYGIKFKVNASVDAPKTIIVSGSNDNTAYDELITIDIEVGVDNIEFTRFFDIDLCNDYAYYKIALTKGTPDGNVSINEYELIKELDV